MDNIQEKLKKVIKRDGRIAKFNGEKIYSAILKAMEVVNGIDKDVARKVTDEVISSINEKTEISVEEIQDKVEDILIKYAHPKVIKEYILYRAQHSDLREYKVELNVDENSKLTVNALSLLNDRYLKILSEGKKETPDQMFKRTAKHIATIEKKYGGNSAKWQKIFYNMMTNQIFFPNMPCLSNSGNEDMNYLSACYILSVEDSISDIFETTKEMALIMQSGGGIGLNLSNIRPRNDIVKTTGKYASGPVGFLPIFDSAVESIKQGGMRRGAALGLLRIDSPDIIEFITCKQQEGKFSNFNLSVAITDKFMSAVNRDSDFSLINPRTGKKANSIRAKYLFDLIAQNAWQSGDPGVVFFDTYNKNNPTPSLGPMYKNACAEVSGLPGECCVLGSINLTKFVIDTQISWSALQKTIENAVHFLDDIIDASNYPLQKIKNITLSNRKIGLGVMGLADLFYILGIPYDSKEAVKLTDKISEFLYIEAKKASEKLAIERGAFPNINISIYTTPIRNASLIVIAPTGEISILGNCSAGIEPNHGLIYKRQTTLSSKELIIINPIFEIIAKREGFFSIELLDKIIKNDGKAIGIKEIPEKWQKVFVTALEISPENHLLIQSTFQKHIDQSISKTINMPSSATVEDVSNIIKMAYDLKCDGVTVFRDGCKKQVMTTGDNSCPDCHIPLVFSEGCFHCPSCGFGGCQI